MVDRIFTEGEIAKSAVPAVLRVSERHARRIVNPLLGRGLIGSESKFAAYRLTFPLPDVEILFPRLFPPASA